MQKLPNTIYVGAFVVAVSVGYLAAGQPQVAVAEASVAHPVQSVSAAPQSQEVEAQPAEVATHVTTITLEALTAGDADSLAMVAIGAAEGTRGPDGSKNPAYQGHTDPGNAAWNKGTCSWQATPVATPEEGDARCLERVKQDFARLTEEAAAMGMKLSLEELVNGLDLANQAPLATKGEGSYLHRLKEARDKGLSGWEAISWARVWSYIDPATGTWNAPGLGNNEADITHDQERRMGMIQKALERNQ